jgi:hypothetical protein
MPVSQNAFSNPVQEESDFYYVINTSEEELMITVKYKELIINWDILGGYYVNYYEHGVIVDRIYLTANFQNGDYVLQNYVLQNKNRYLDDGASYIGSIFLGTFYWKYVMFFRRLTGGGYIYKMSREQILKVYGEENAEQFPPCVSFEYRKLSGYEILSLFIDEFTVTDISGNIIMTLKDINESYFEENNVAAHIEEYSESFYNLPRYKNYGNDEAFYLMYGIFITQEMVDNGRKMYIEKNNE